MDNGTYIKLGRANHAIVEAESGYWVATEEVQWIDLMPSELFGVWTDDSGKLWLDRVQWVETKTEALQLGIQHKQLAIWNIKKKEEISLVD